MKKRSKMMSILLTAGAVALVMSPMKVYAGGINGAEQMIINYYNGTFSYNGKQYVATEAAKASAYSWLASDGVDLTESEARSAIGQASASIAQGIADGLLVEVGGGDNSGDGEEAGGSNTGDGETGEAGGDAGEGNTEAGGATEEPGESEGGSGKKPDKDKKPVKKPDKVEVGGTEVYSESVKNVENEYENVEELKEQLPNDESVVIQNFVDSEVEVSRGDKTILKNTLPVKNTGYDTIKLPYLLAGAGALLMITIAAAMWQIYFARKDGQK